MTRRRRLFVTGCYRSGTTLLEKLLHSHEATCAASQPFPVLFFLAKERFLTARRLTRRYPLEHLFGEREYTLEDVTAFLRDLRLGTTDLTELFDRLERYDEGLWTPEILAFRDRIDAGSFGEVLEQLTLTTARALGREDADVIGSKEILCEEYVPFLLADGVSTAVVIRDPRDMIASLNFRARDNLTGVNRPILYSLRVWRKSVAIALAHEREQSFAWLRYEDLVADPAAALDGVVSRLDLPRFPNSLPRTLLAQDGSPWRGNSSFGDMEGVSTSSVGVWTQVLPPEVAPYVEAICGPEMRALGYPIAGDDPPDAIVTRFRDPFEEIHERFPVDYSSSPARVALELERLSVLHAKEEADEATIRRLFVDPRAFRRLRHIPAAS